MYKRFYLRITSSLYQGCTLMGQYVALSCMVFNISFEHQDGLSTPKHVFQYYICSKEDILIVSFYSHA